MSLERTFQFKVIVLTSSSMKSTKISVESADWSTCGTQKIFLGVFSAVAKRTEKNAKTIARRIFNASDLFSVIIIIISATPCSLLTTGTKGKKRRIQTQKERIGKTGKRKEEEDDVIVDFFLRRRI
jgi:hypothetical protein|tara:strand:- start:159 stop:536 length:378 start_codon:yes stop_codon:yes gene_type:complete